jgi:hypothetical protein
MRRSVSLWLFILLLAVIARAQQASSSGNQSANTRVKREAEQKRETQAKERRGSIGGRVVSESGQPLAHVGVRIIAAGGRAQMNQRNLGTDEEGKFQADDLPSVSYSISPYAPGYVSINKSTEPKFYRIGDNVTYTMTKGGVITGQVKTASGEPVINVSVRAIRIKDAEGKPLRSEARRYERMTDDRGIYRLYSMESGTYVIAAGGNNFYTTGYDKYSEDIPTYYPSSTRDTANEVTVLTGQELSGIDIAYRGEKGHAVSGNIANHSGFSPDNVVSVVLANAASGVTEANLFVNLRSGNRSFGFYGIADGEYLIKAQYAPFNSEKDSLASAPKRIAVKAGDVTGLELALAPLASISGRLIFEALADEEAKRKCETRKSANLEEAIIFIRRDSKGETAPQAFFNQAMQFSGDEKGEFSLYRFEAGLYRFAANLPSESWYIKSIGFADRAKANQPLTRNVQLSDVASSGLSVKAGERVNDLTIVLAEGAASVIGKVMAAAEGETLPPNLRVYLVPTERERAGDVLRFAQANVQSDGAFSLTGIAPGKYWMLARIITDEELTGVTTRQPVWDTEGRNTLRKEAEAANKIIELQMCQRIVDYSWRYAPQPVTTKPITKKTQ